MKFELDNSRVLREIAPDDDMAHGNHENYFALGESALLDCIEPALEASPAPDSRGCGGDQEKAVTAPAPPCTWRSWSVSMILS